VVEKVRTDDPATYLRVMAGVLPKELEVSHPLDDIGDAELVELIALITRRPGCQRRRRGRPSIAGELRRRGGCHPCVHANGDSRSFRESVRHFELCASRPEALSR
jgi:hypothetical protein